MEFMCISSINVDKAKLKIKYVFSYFRLVQTKPIYMGMSQNRGAITECPKPFFSNKKSELGAFLFWDIPIYIYMLFLFGYGISISQWMTVVHTVYISISMNTKAKNIMWTQNSLIMPPIQVNLMFVCFFLSIPNCSCRLYIVVDCRL